MSLKKEFEKLVKEANRKLVQQNKKKEAEESQVLESLKKRQEMLIHILSKNNMAPKVSHGYQE